METLTMGRASSIVGIEEANTFMAIRYEGLNRYEDYDLGDNYRNPHTVDDVDEYTDWWVDGPFNARDCSDAVASCYVSGGGTLNMIQASW